jgi:hypothetical protein
MPQGILFYVITTYIALHHMIFSGLDFRHCERVVLSTIWNLKSVFPDPEDFLQFRWFRKHVVLHAACHSMDSEYEGSAGKGDHLILTRLSCVLQIPLGLPRPTCTCIFITRITQSSSHVTSREYFIGLHVKYPPGPLIWPRKQTPSQLKSIPPFRKKKKKRLS